jgi:hypothetical protein
MIDLDADLFLDPLPAGLDDPFAVADAISASALRLWAEAVDLRTERGRRLDFGPNRRWLQLIWDDPAKQIAVKKSTQTHISTFGIAWSLHKSAILGQTGIYVLPTDLDVRIFAQGRIDPIIDACPSLARLQDRAASDRRRAGTRKATDSVHLKRLGRGLLYLRGCQTERSAISVPADYLIRDEYDYQRAEIRDTFIHRLDAHEPEDYQILDISTPTAPGVGIAARYADSDQSVWMVRCSHCNQDQELDYVRHTEEVLDWLKCERCGGALDPRAGQWIAKFPDRAVRGYHVTKLLLCVPERPSRLRILHERRQKAEFPYLFQNNDLGKESTEGTARLDPETILSRCFLEDYEFANAAQHLRGPYYAGIDQGDTLNVVIIRMDPRYDGGKIRVVYLARLRDPAGGSDAWRQLAILLRAFNVRMAVVDALPNKNNAGELARVSDLRRRVLLCYYSEGDQRAEVVEAADVRRRAETRDRSRIETTERVDITVDRTLSLDHTVADVAGGVVLLPGPVSHPEFREFIANAGGVVRKPIKNAKGQLVYIYERVAADHYLHALNYARIAAEEASQQADRDPGAKGAGLLYSSLSR